MPGTTPAGWPYLLGIDSLDITPDWSLDLANKLSGVSTAPGTVIDSGWISLSLTSGISGSLQYRFLSGVVYLRGAVTRSGNPWTTSYSTIATLPTGRRPSALVTFSVPAYDPVQGAQCAVNTSGGISIRAGSAGAVAADLSGVSFPL